MSVFVVQQPKLGPNNFAYDISPCLEFGNPVFIFDAADQPGLAPVPSKRRAMEILRNFSDSDYILWAGGDPAGLAIVSAVAADINQGRFNFLRWERERVNNQRNGRGYYVPIKINMRMK